MSTTTLIAGNLVSLAGSIVMVCIGFIKSRNRILLAQNLQFLFMGLGNLILGGVSGFIANVISILRNFFCLKFAYTRNWKIFFVVLQTGISVVTLYFSGFTWKEILPILSTILYTCSLGSEDAVFLKKVMIVCTAMWVVYDLVNLNITAFVFDLLTITTTTLSIMRIHKNNMSDASGEKEKK